MSDVWIRRSGQGPDGPGAVYDLGTGPVKFSLWADQLRGVGDPTLQRHLFKRFVKRVVIETSSYSNRRCGFCPNADGSQLGAFRMMPEEAFLAVLDDLAEIGFDKTILFHFYNEPLANPRIIDQVALARQKLPTAVLSFNSNGDYIRSDTLEKLVRAGLSSLHISIYGPNHGVFDAASVEDRVADMAETCGLPRDATKWVSALECRATGKFMDGARALPITIQAKNFNEVGYDRGAFVEIAGIAPTFQRRSPCPSPFDELLLTWDGTAVPCCNVVGDKPENSAFTVGRLAERGSIFSNYADSPLVDWRWQLLKFADHGGPCAQSTRFATPLDEFTAQHRSFNEQADQLLQVAAIREARVN